MSSDINASVGTAARNYRIDVEVVQRLLAQRGLYRGQIDGRCGPLTVGAILQFQNGFLHAPDGRIDVGGVTWRHLSGAQVSHPTGVRPSVPVAHVVPVKANHSPAAPQGPSLTAGQALTALVPKPKAGTVNVGLRAVSPSFMVQKLGQPRQSYSSECQPVTNETLKRHIVTQSLGRFSVTGLDAAVESLRSVLEQMQRDQPAVYDALGTAGMLCSRYIRGSSTAVSNHSWGTAVDLTINGVLDRRGDDKVQVGMLLIVPIFNQHGWYWGGAFKTEDGMHFEASETLITQWAPRIR